MKTEMKTKSDPPYFYVVEWFLEKRDGMSLVDVHPRWRYRVITQNGIRSWAVGTPSEKLCWKTKAGAEKQRRGRSGPTQVVLRGQKVEPDEETQKEMLRHERDFMFERIAELSAEVADLRYKMDEIGRALS